MISRKMSVPIKRSVVATVYFKNERYRKRFISYLFPVVLLHKSHTLLHLTLLQMAQIKKYIYTH